MKNEKVVAPEQAARISSDSPTAPQAGGTRIDAPLLIAAAEHAKAHDAWLWHGGTQLDDHDMARCAAHPGCAKVALVEGALAMAAAYPQLVEALKDMLAHSGPASDAHSRMEARRKAKAALALTEAK